MQAIELEIRGNPDNARYTYIVCYGPMETQHHQGEKTGTWAGGISSQHVQKNGMLKATVTVKTPLAATVTLFARLHGSTEWSLVDSEKVSQPEQSARTVTLTGAFPKS